MTSNDNKVEDWLPKEYPETQDLRWFKQHFENETFILVSWEGCTLADPRLELLQNKLLSSVNLIYPKPPTLFHAGWQKLFPPAQPPEPVIGPPMYKTVETGPTLLKRLTEGTSKLSETEALDRLAGLFVGKENHDLSCAVVTLTDEGKRDLRHTLESLYGFCKDDLGLPHERVKMGGPPVDNVAISTEGEKTLIRLFGPAGVVGLCLAFWCLRSTRLTLMVFVTAIYSGAISLSIIYYTGGAMNAILMTMPAVVYVAAVSGASTLPTTIAIPRSKGASKARRPGPSIMHGFPARSRRSPAPLDWRRCIPASCCRSSCSVFTRRSACWLRWGCCSCSCRPGCRSGR